jgi:hypothetical protein
MQLFVRLSQGTEKGNGLESGALDALMGNQMRVTSNEPRSWKA